MPLHNWAEDEDVWYRVYKIWMFEMLKWVFPLLPAEYRVYFREVYFSFDGVVEDLDLALHVETAQQDRVIATIGVILPKDKHRPAARERFLERYRGHLRNGVHLLVIDVLPQPEGVSFADEIAASFDLRQPALPPPFVASYRVESGAVTGSSWPLVVGQTLPVVSLALDAEREVLIDLECAYREAAKRAYLT
jgi:hypothetical protein